MLLLDLLEYLKTKKYRAQLLYYYSCDLENFDDELSNDGLIEEEYFQRFLNDYSDYWNGYIDEYNIEINSNEKMIYVIYISEYC